MGYTRTRKREYFILTQEFKSLGFMIRFTLIPCITFVWWHFTKERIKFAHVNLTWLFWTITFDLSGNLGKE